MPTIDVMMRAPLAMMRAPLAMAYWLGVGARRTSENGDDIIFLYHGTPRCVANQLERQLRYLQRLFRLVPLAAIAASLGGRRPAGRRRQAAIIFDDGLRSNVVVAYPILRALGIPATFFVCPGLIEERMWLWTHEARRRLQFAGPHLRGELATELTAPADVEAFVQWMKHLDLPARKCVEAKVREATASFVPTGLDREAFELADWHGLRSLDPSIVTVGSHSMTHPILPRMSALEIETELRDSRCMLEAKLGRPVELFSYPNGDVDGQTNAAVRRHYRAAVAHQSGMPLDPHLLPSVHPPRGVLGVLRLAWKLNRQAAAAAEVSRHRVSATGLTSVSLASSSKSLIASPAAAASPSEDVPRESTDVLTDWLNDVPHDRHVPYDAVYPMASNLDHSTHGADHRLDNPRDHLKHTVG